MRVKVHGGLTFQVGPSSGNQYGRVDVEMSDIDPDANIEAQIEGGVKAAQAAWKATLAELDRQVEELYEKK